MEHSTQTSTGGEDAPSAARALRGEFFCCICLTDATAQGAADSTSPTGSIIAPCPRDPRHHVCSECWGAHKLEQCPICRANLSCPLCKLPLEGSVCCMAMPTSAADAWARVISHEGGIEHLAAVTDNGGGQFLHRACALVVLDTQRTYADKLRSYVDM